MPKRKHFDEYRDKYENFEFELGDDGILLMRQHTDGDSLVWNAEAHDRMADAFSDVSGDRGVKLVTLTGAAENRNADWGCLAKAADTGDEGPKLGWAPPVEFMDNLAWAGRTSS